MCAYRFVMLLAVAIANICCSPFTDERSCKAAEEEGIIQNGRSKCQRVVILDQRNVSLAPPWEALTVDPSTRTEESLISLLCPRKPPDLKGEYHVGEEAPPLPELERRFPELLAGGAWRPTKCFARHRVAIIIPYRDRAAHLATLLHALHPFLQRQQLDYRIIVVEQADDAAFNRGMLMNVGFVEAAELYCFKCFIFHDVDLLPENDRNLYTCTDRPLHLSSAVDRYDYRLPYKFIFGGVTALNKQWFIKFNGYSNSFWGWGSEDDDFANRIRSHGYAIHHKLLHVGRYKSLNHSKARENPKRHEICNNGEERFLTDGLNSLSYQCEEVRLYRTHTHISVYLTSSNDTT